MIAPDIEKEVPKLAAFFDRDRVGDDRFESQDTFIKLPGLVEVKRREADVGKSSWAMALTPRVQISSDGVQWRIFQAAALMESVSIRRMISGCCSRL